MKDSSTEQYELIKYRGDIDGLRAIAVIAVVIYHAFPKFIKGGFVGVDIFFTLSGYLIGSILFKNFDSKKFCIYTFYARRIKRIFPALLLVLLFSLVFGWFSLTAVEYTALSIHARASTFFYTNFTLAKEGGYFDTSVHTKPLMHLWSLALEEQFYIFCPLILYFFTRKNFNIISICIVFILSSFIFSIKTLHTYPIQAFYYPLCRAWELVSGVLLSYIIYNKIEFPKKSAEIINYYLSLIAYKSRSFYSPNISLTPVAN
jgi:peptidoglycan/LPS O-acetylase OafA/YrhL